MSHRKRKTPQNPKPRNIDWRDARLQHSNRNLTVPSGKAYKRDRAGARGRDW